MKSASYFILKFLCLYTFSILHAQTNSITFNYDAKGNLIERKVRSTFQAKFSNSAIDSTIKEPQFLVSPNPSNTFLNIENIKSNVDNQVYIEITSINGQIIKSIESNSSKSKIDVSNITSGIYLLIIYNSNKTKEIHKIIISD